MSLPQVRPPPLALDIVTMQFTRCTWTSPPLPPTHRCHTAQRSCGPRCSALSLQRCMKEKAGLAMTKGLAMTGCHNRRA
eukprot:1045176-Pelagomonas_calceolata.AAC.10